VQTSQRSFLSTPAIAPGEVDANNGDMARPRARALLVALGKKITTLRLHTSAIAGAWSAALSTIPSR
jgi:hypothetical protein